MSRKEREEYELKYWKKNGLKKGLKYFRDLHMDRLNFFNKMYNIPNNLNTALEIGSGPFGGMSLVYNARFWYLLDPLHKEYSNIVNMKDEKTVVRLKNYCEDIPLKDKSVEIVFSCNSLDHADNYIKCIEEIYRVMKKDGLFYLLVDCRTKDQLNIGHIHFFTPNQMVEFITNAGFNLIDRKNTKRESKSYLNLAAVFKK